MSLTHTRSLVRVREEDDIVLLMHLVVALSHQFEILVMGVYYPFYAAYTHVLLAYSEGMVVVKTYEDDLAS